MPLTQSPAPNRSHIAKTDIKRWAKHFSVTHELLEAAIAKVGTSVDAAQHELMRSRLRADRKNSGSSGASLAQKRTKPMEMQSSDQGAAAVPMATASSTSKKRSNQEPTISRTQAESKRKTFLKTQRTAQKT